MPAHSAAILCVLLMLSSCGDVAPPEPEGGDRALGTGVIAPPTAAIEQASDEIAGADDPLPGTVGVHTPVQLHDLALPRNAGLWRSQFLTYLDRHGISVCDAVAPRPRSSAANRWAFKVIRVLRQFDHHPLVAGAVTDWVIAPGVRIQNGDRVVLLGNWHKTGLNVIAFWRHSEMLVASIRALHETLSWLKRSATVTASRAGNWPLPRWIRTNSICVFTVEGPDDSAPERGPDRWLIRIHEVVRGTVRTGLASCRMPEPHPPAREDNELRIGLLGGHLPTRRVIGWWKHSPEALAAIKSMAAPLSAR